MGGIPKDDEVHLHFEQIRTEAATATGILPGDIAMSARLSYGLRGYAIHIQHEMHPDADGRRGNDVIGLEGKADWRIEMARAVTEVYAQDAHLVHRRRAVDAHRRPEGRWAWSIHPVAASILKGAGRLPRMDGTHRLTGGLGRHFSVDGPGFTADVHYGAGVVRVTTAEYRDADGVLLLKAYEEEGRMKAHVACEIPDTVLAAGRPRIAQIADVLSADPRTADCRITGFARVPSDRIEDGFDPAVAVWAMTFQDVLVPWDASCRGGEAWRRTRLVANKGRKDGKAA